MYVPSQTLTLNTADYASVNYMQPMLEAAYSRWNSCKVLVSIDQSDYTASDTCYDACSACCYFGYQNPIQYAGNQYWLQAPPAMNLT
jgi:hypothetical protein